MYIILLSNYHSCKWEAINLVLHYLIDMIHKTVKLSHLKKSQIIQKQNNLNNVPGLLNIFWLNFNKAHHSFLHPFCLGKNWFSKTSTWSFDWGTGAWVHAYSRNVNNIKLKNVSHTWWYIQVRENSRSILERDKT